MLACPCRSGRPGVPRLNLEPIVQEREAELAHEPAYMVAAEPDESEELVRRRAPPVETPDTYYYYPKFKDKVRCCAL